MRPGQVVDDRFLIERLAGQGGTARVFLATDRITGLPVAIKRFHAKDEGPGFVRFLREAEILASMNHPFIVRYVAHGTFEGHPYLALEWVEGEMLSSLFKRRRLTVDEAKDLLLKLLSALAVTHEKGIVHRDLKPQNILLHHSRLDAPKILDFGIALLANTPASGITGTGVFIGSPGYMAPEQVLTSRDVDARADLFALGSLLFQSLTGQIIFQGDDALSYFVRVITEDAPRVSSLLPDFPAGLDDLIACLLARKPEARPANAKVLFDELVTLDLSNEAVLEESTFATKSLRTLTESEQRVSCAVLVRPTSESNARALAAHAAHVCSPFEGQAEALIDGHWMISFGRAATAMEQAVRAARCALALRTAVSGLAIAVVELRREDGMELGDRLHSCLRLLDRENIIRVNDGTAGLLGTRFHLGGDETGLWIDEEHDIDRGARTLLGKPTPFVGRQDELSLICNAFRQTLRESKGRAILVLGDAGTGKSRLREEFTQWLETQSVRVNLWIAKGDPIGHQSAFGMLKSALRRALGIHAADMAAVARRKLQSRVARNLRSSEYARVTEFLMELLGLNPMIEGSLRLDAARQSAELMGSQMLSAFKDFAASECKRTPLIIMLEDLHFGDRPSAKCIESLISDLPGLPIFVLAFARPDVERTLPDVFQGASAQKLELKALSAQACEELVRAVIGARTKDAIVASLVERSAGNAFYLEELIRAAAQGKFETLPSSVSAMIEASLQELDPSARLVLRAASIFGPGFYPEGVAVLLRKPAAEIQSELDRLVQREILECRAADEWTPKYHQRTFCFRQLAVRETVYSMLTGDDRKLGHRVASQWLEAQGNVDPMVLAEHCERGGELGRAVDYFHRAAQEALRGSDMSKAMERTQRAIACGAAGKVLGSVLLTRAEASRWKGDNREALRCASEARPLLTLGSDAWCAACAELVVAAVKMGDSSVGATAVQDLALFGSETTADYSPAYVIALARAAGSLVLSGQLVMADMLFAKVENTRGEKAKQNPLVLGRLFESYALRAFASGDLGAAVSHCEKALQAFNTVQDRPNTAVLQNNQGCGLLEMGAYEEAAQAFSAALSVSETLNLSQIICATRQNLGYTLAHLGRYDEAYALIAKSIREAVFQQNHRLEGGARIYMATVSVMSGKLHHAEADARAAVAALNSHPPLKAYALAVLSAIELAKGDAQNALSLAKDALDILHGMGGAIEEGEAKVRLSFIEALIAAGDLDSAKHALIEAVQRLRARASQISVPIRRRSFLIHVPDHRRTFELAARMGIAVPEIGRQSFYSLPPE